ncbi:hypothetical protein [Cognaticolwellia beringensis]|uniref:PEP-CTERM sorting domain-containing protein n=1 Tax=Cognaticolwellia beringensis TaxID=1967665 RepID=A0A222GBT0_9GAMM|nr:hypothetical protein [Cognaticolwellia beringensis]ASP49162.1 hypothetical protein B5D82_16150 [Cognaticolwellia beringensis]
MNQFQLKITATLFTCLLAGKSYASLISYDLLTPNSSPHISYANPFTDAFSSNADGFQIYQRNVDLNIPNALLDNSDIGADSLGIITRTNTQAFFGIVDTVNLNNPSNDAVASWQVDITNLTAIKLLIDMAAMGDFESSDEFEWRYSIDNNPFSSLFQGVSNLDSQQSYRLKDNSLKTLNDPMTVNSILLSNQFTAFSSSILDTGNLLTIELKANANSDNEAIAFQNVFIQGVSNTVTVSEPKSFVIMIFALLFFTVSQVLFRQKSGGDNRMCFKA